MIAACQAPAYVSHAKQEYALIAPETADVHVRHGSTIAIPLYDGSLAPGSSWRGTLQYMGTVVVPSYQCFKLAPYVAGSHRVALFRVIGGVGTHTFVPVQLRLAQMPERCASCRMVHFFVRVVR